MKTEENQTAAAPLTPEAIEDIKNRLRDSGLAFKVAYTDKNPALGIHGFRITNARRLLSECVSIQIFNRETVAIARDGFTNDDHISFTEDDGAAILDAIKGELPEALWDAIPPAPPRRGRPGPINDAKAELVSYLASAFPGQFGPYGTATASTDFYESLLALFRTKELVEPTVWIARDFIVMLEAEARAQYQQAARTLKQCELAQNAETRLRLAFRALEHNAAAQVFREIAHARRTSSAAQFEHYEMKLPEPNYPEALDMADLQTTVIFAIDMAAVADGLKEPPPAAPPATPQPIEADLAKSRVCPSCSFANHGLRQDCYRCGTSLGRLAHEAAAGTAAAPAQKRLAGIALSGPGDVEDGMLVVVTDGQHARYGQMGQVTKDPSIVAPTAAWDTCCPVRFNDGAAELLEYAKLNAIQ